jgi:hypothetical protein
MQQQMPRPLMPNQLAGAPGMPRPPYQQQQILNALMVQRHLQQQQQQQQQLGQGPGMLSRPMAPGGAPMAMRPFQPSPMSLTGRGLAGIATTPVRGRGRGRGRGRASSSPGAAGAPLPGSAPPAGGRGRGSPSPMGLAGAGATPGTGGRGRGRGRGRGGGGSGAGGTPGGGGGAGGGLKKTPLKDSMQNVDANVDDLEEAQQQQGTRAGGVDLWGRFAVSGFWWRLRQGSDEGRGLKTAAAVR